MVTINQQFDYPILSRTQVNGQRLYDVLGHNVPSVTTVIGKTKDMTGINKWRERVGKEEAQRILTEAANLGTCTHKNIEQHLFGKERKSDGNLIHQIAYKLADVVIEQGLVNVNEIWGSEVSLYSPELYAGTTDCVGVWNGKPAIIDFKTSRSKKKREWIEDYFLQCSAYAMAHNELFKTDIETIVIMMVTHDGTYLEFSVSGDDYRNHEKLWLDKLKEYYRVYDKY